MEKELKTLPADVKDFIYGLYKISLNNGASMHYTECPENEFKNNAICIKFDISKELEYKIKNSVSLLMGLGFRGYMPEPYSIHHGTNADDDKYCVIITTEDNNINLVTEFIDNELKTYKSIKEWLMHI